MQLEKNRLFHPKSGPSIIKHFFACLKFLCFLVINLYFNEVTFIYCIFNYFPMHKPFWDTIPLVAIKLQLMGTDKLKLEIA